MLETHLLELIDSVAPSATHRDVRDICSGKQIVVYGAGSGFDTLSAFVLEKFGYRPNLVLDKKFAAKTAHKGIPAGPPSVDFPPVNSTASQENHLVIVSIGRKDLHEAVLKQLGILGYRNIILALDIHEYHLSHTPASISDQGIQYYRNHREEIVDAFKLLADEMSREVFGQVLRTYLSRETHPIPSRPLSEEYFPSDIRLSKGYSRMINCGSYTGDTVKQLLARKGRLESLACFEPDAENYAQLALFLASCGAKIAGTIAAFPCGVYDKTARRSFSGGHSVNSNLNGWGKEEVQCVRLDDALPQFSPTFINMDVEGAEPEALAGAKNLIRRGAPDLAICAYHSVNHLWELPLQVKALNGDYRLFLRNYTGYPAETVLYATTNQRNSPPGRRG